MLGVDPEIGTAALRSWVAAGSAALLIVICTLALFRSPSRMAAGPVLGAGVMVLSAVLGAAMTWGFLDRANDHGSERRALERRAEELNARILAPGSPLACLDAFVGQNVEAACEKALFISPASVAAATSYVAARLALLSDLAAYAGRGGADIDGTLLPLRRSLEADRFGFLAYLLAIRDGCTSQNCKALALLHDASQVRDNLSAATLDHYLEHYLALWAKAPDGALAESPPPSTTAQLSPPSARKLVNIDFPSAASIPAVSIMNPEPTGPIIPGAAAAAASNPNPPRHSRKQAAAPSAQTAIQPTLSSSAATEPIWPEPVPPPPSPQTSAVQPAAGPMQLTPLPPNASAGTTVHAQ